MQALRTVSSAAGLIYLNYGEAGQERGDADEVEEEVCGGAFALLVWGMGWLKDQGCLCDEQEPSLRCMSVVRPRGVRVVGSCLQN